MEMREYLMHIAAQLVHELQPVLQIKEVTANTDLQATGNSGSEG
jgi:hypothetical protein